MVTSSKTVYVPPRLKLDAKCEDCDWEAVNPDNPGVVDQAQRHTAETTHSVQIQGECDIPEQS